MAVRFQAGDLFRGKLGFLFLLLHACLGSSEELKWDENGYVLYCPCMGNSLFTASYLCFLLLKLELFIFRSSEDGTIGI